MMTQTDNIARATMRKKYMTIVLSLCLLLPLLQSEAVAQEAIDFNEKILNLMEEIFEQIPADLPEIDPSLKRISVYRLQTDDVMIPAPLRQHFEGRLVHIFGILGEPKVVALPEMSTLKISSTDSSFRILNAMPSPDELWKVGRRLRVDAFLEGQLTYVAKKALYLDLRLNRTGTNEVLWAKSYAAYEKSFKVDPINPLRKSFNAGLEVFQIHLDALADSLVGQDFKNRLVQYSVYFGIYQFITPNSRLRYEVRAGMSFLSEGANLNNRSFSGDSFYSLSPGTSAISRPVSYNFRAMLYASLLQNKDNRSGDWLSVYASLTRYFAYKIPDITGIGIGFRSDLSSRFSISAGFSMILAPEFVSQTVSPSGERGRIDLNGLQYEVFLLQLSL